MLESVRRPPIHRRVPLQRRANRIPPAIVPTMHDDDDDVSVVPTAPWLVHENRHGGRFRRRGGERRIRHCPVDVDVDVISFVVVRTFQGTHFFKYK